MMYYDLLPQFPNTLSEIYHFQKQITHIYFMTPSSFESKDLT